MKQIILRPGDVAVAIQMAMSPSRTMAATAEMVGRSVGEVHNAVSRLTAAGLIHPETRSVYREPLLRFIQWGVPHAFPAVMGGSAIGIASGWHALVAAGDASPEDVIPNDRMPYVWPSADGLTRGIALQPLYPITVHIAAQNRPLWIALAMVDVIRTGGARETAAAMTKLDAVVPPMPSPGP
jgi:hypothetical protein